MIAFTWLHKPADVRTPIILYTSTTATSLVGGRSWINTPLDFIDENGPGWSMNVQPFMEIPVIPSRRPLQRIPNDRFPTNPYGSQEYLLCVATLIFTGLHVAGRNFSFPSSTEKVLWRVASLILLLVTAAFWILETAASWMRLGRWKLLYSRLLRDDRRINELEREAAAKCSTSPTRELMTLPLPWESHPWLFCTELLLFMSVGQTTCLTSDMR